MDGWREGVGEGVKEGGKPEEGGMNHIAGCRRDGLLVNHGRKLSSRSSLFSTILTYFVWLLTPIKRSTKILDQIAVAAARSCLTLRLIALRPCFDAKWDDNMLYGTFKPFKFLFWHITLPQSGGKKIFLLPAGFL